MPVPRTALIGAGSSGLTVLKALLEAHVPVVCFERGSMVGGNWVLHNDNQQSHIYRSLRINTSRDRMQFSDFPMPRDYPDYAGHAQVARYFESYAEAFQLRRAIRFQTQVSRVERAEQGFTLTTAAGEQEHFGAVVVANGHHWDPAWPEPPIPGRFSGRLLHSHAYVSPNEPHALASERVAVVGIGNSAVDIASELAQAGAKVCLSTRRGAWVLPKYAFGRPIDQRSVLPRWLSDEAKTKLAELWYRLKVGDVAELGLPRPDHRLGHAHPTLSDEFLPLVRQGKIKIRPSLVGFEGNLAHFSDGAAEAFDTIIFATGYKVSFPFFEPSFVAAPNNELPLFLRCFHWQEPGLMFAGLCQPLGAIMPLVEAQGRLFARYLTGRYELPCPQEMERRTLRERELVRRRFVASARHTMQVDFDRYLADLARESRAGERRSGRRSTTP